MTLKSEIVNGLESLFYGLATDSEVRLLNIEHIALAYARAFARVAFSALRI